MATTTTQSKAPITCKNLEFNGMNFQWRNINSNHWSNKDIPFIEADKKDLPLLDFGHIHYFKDKKAVTTPRNEFFLIADFDDAKVLAEYNCKTWDEFKARLAIYFPTDIITSSASGKCKVFFWINAKTDMCPKDTDWRRGLLRACTRDFYEFIDTCDAAMTTCFMNSEMITEFVLGLEGVRMMSSSSLTNSLCKNASEQYTLETYEGELPVSVGGVAEEILRIMLASPKAETALPQRLLSAQFGVSQKTISNEIALLVKSGLIICTNNSYAPGKRAKVYSLNTEALQEIRQANSQSSSAVSKKYSVEQLQKDFPLTEGIRYVNTPVWVRSLKHLNSDKIINILCENGYDKRKLAIQRVNCLLRKSASNVTIMPRKTTKKDPLAKVVNE